MRHRNHRLDVRLALDVRIGVAVRTNAERRALGWTDFVVLRDVVEIGRESDARTGRTGGVDVAVEPVAAFVLRAWGIPVGEPAGLRFPELAPAEFQCRPAISEQVIGRAESRGQIADPVRRVFHHGEVARRGKASGRHRGFINLRIEVFHAQARIQCQPLDRPRVLHEIPEVVVHMN